MTEVESDKCPLCYLVTDKVEHHMLKHSWRDVCSSCGDLAIKERSVSWLESASAQAKKAFADEAQKTPQGMVLFIHSSQVAEPNQWTRAERLTLAEALNR